MITLEKTAQPLGLSISLADEPEAVAPHVVDEQDGPVAEAEEIVARIWPLIESARSVIAAQNSIIESQRAEIERLQALMETRDEVEEVKGELDDTREMIQALERDLAQVARPQRLPVVASLERPYSHRARQVLDGDPLFIDYETTGLSKDDRVVEVCVIDGSGRVLLSTLVNPERHIPAQATAVNGIDDDDVSDAPTWAEVAPALESLIGGRTVVAHNASFEAKYTPQVWGVRWVCSKKVADQALGKAAYTEIARNKQRGGSLEARLWQCGLTAGPEHTAAGDCISALRLMMYLAGDDRPTDLIY
jgi:DNA polymerase-3 subunit epsilon